MKRHIFLAVGAASALAAIMTPLSVSADERIVGGQAADNGEYPFFASLQRSGNTPFERHWCGGSLIDPQTVLTAAHCVDGLTAEDLAVAVGRTSLNDTSTGEEIQVVEIVSHPQYVSVEQGYDVALLRLAEPSSAPTVSLAGPDDADLVEPDDDSTVIGHGAISSGGAGSERLLEVNVPIQPDDYMATQYSSYDAATMVGAGPREGGRDSCQGDSGGPLMVFGDAGPKQIGVVSWGEGCAAPDFPGIYAEVYQGELQQWVFDNLTSDGSLASGGTQG